MRRPPGLFFAALALVTCRTPPAPRPTAHTSAPVQRVNPARIRVARAPEDLLGGPNAAGRFGDFVIENDHLRAVIERLPGGRSFALTGGSLLDLAAREGDGFTRDELGQVFTLLGEFPRQITYTRESHSVASDGTATLTFRSDPSANLEGVTEYVLGPDARALTIRTTLTRGPNAPLVQGATLPLSVRLADAIQCGGAAHWVPDFGFARPAPTARFAWIAGLGHDTAYAFVGEQPFRGPSSTHWINPSQGDVDLWPGERVTYTRRIAASGHLDLVRALEHAGASLGNARVTVHVRAPLGEPVADARVTLHPLLRDDAGVVPSAPVMLATTDASGDATIPLAPGEYRVSVTAPGRHERSDAPVTITAREASPASVEVALSPRSSLVIRARADGVPSPARVIIRGLDGTPSPLLGASGRADGAGDNVITDARGEITVPLAPGRYELTATHGIAHSLATATVTLTEGQRDTVTLDLRRVIARDGYVCGDFHQHQAPSLDAPVSLRDRVLADVAEGLDVVASTDHNMASDLGETVREMGLAGQLLTLAGDEVSTDVASAPIGHVNLFPIPVDRDAARGGAPSFFDLDVPTFLARARAWAPDAVVQVNHPRAPGPTGMFSVVHFNPRTGRAEAPFDPHFDAVEIWNGRWQSAIAPVLDDWFAMLRAGARVTATGNSDSHAITTQEAGYPRTCLAVPDATQFTAADVTRALRETRDVFVTDGPHVTVTDAQGRSVIGRAVRAPARLTVTVTSARWCAATDLERIDSDGRRARLVTVNDVTRDTVRQRGTLDIPRAAVRSPSPRFVVVRAFGDGAIPVLAGDPPLRPEAITNPIWIE